MVVCTSKLGLIISNNYMIDMTTDLGLGYLVLVLLNDVIVVKRQSVMPSNLLPKQNTKKPKTWRRS